VLLSSLRLIAALGGKSENGAEKEKKVRNDDFSGGARDAAAAFERRIVVINRKKRKMDAAEKSTRMATLGGRIAGQSSGCSAASVWALPCGTTGCSSVGGCVGYVRPSHPANAGC
jgi:hypothetical protein